MCLGTAMAKTVQPELIGNENRPKVSTEMRETFCLLPAIKFFTLLPGPHIWIFLRHLTTKWHVKWSENSKSEPIVNTGDTDLVTVLPH